TIATASAPAGRGAPVMISTHSPAATAVVAAAPAATSPTRRSDRGTLATSALRTAKPSRVARWNGGWSRPAPPPQAHPRPAPRRPRTDSARRAPSVPCSAPPPPPAPAPRSTEGSCRLLYPDVRGLLLINLGSPDEPTTPAVRRYLREFLSDPRVIDINPVG